MSNPNRVDKGVPTGGEFSARQREDSGTALIAASGATAATDVVDKLRAFVREMEIRAVVTDIETATLALFPTATSVALSRNAFGYWNFSHVVSGDQQLSETGGKFYDENSDVHALSDAIEPLIYRFGSSSDPIDSNAIGANLRLDFDPRPDIAEIDRRILEVGAVSHAVSNELSALCSQGIVASIQSQYPTATRLDVVEESWDNGVFFSARKIVNANGDVLWDSDEHDELEELGVHIQGYLIEIRQEDLSEADPESDYFVALV